jgi:hypothetical protein
MSNPLDKKIAAKSCLSFKMSWKVSIGTLGGGGGGGGGAGLNLFEFRDVIITFYNEKLSIED